MRNFNDELQNLMDEFTRISLITNNFEQMQEYVKMPKMLEEIWKEGFEAGAKELNEKEL